MRVPKFICGNVEKWRAEPTTSRTIVWKRSQKKLQATFATAKKMGATEAMGIILHPI